MIPKGVTNNPNGRPKGAVSTVTRESKELVLKAISNQLIEFDATMDKIRDINPIEWAKIMTKLFGYVLPQKIENTESKSVHIPIGAWLNSDVNTETTQDTTSLDATNDTTLNSTNDAI